MIGTKVKKKHTHTQTHKQISAGRQTGQTTRSTY